MAIEVEGLVVGLLRSEIQRTYADVSTQPDQYARSAFEDTRRTAEKFGARGTPVRATKP